MYKLSDFNVGDIVYLDIDGWYYISKINALYDEGEGSKTKDPYISLRDIWTHHGKLANDDYITLEDLEDEKIHILKLEYDNPLISRIETETLTSEDVKMEVANTYPEYFI